MISPTRDGTAADPQRRDDAARLLDDYVAICNRAIAENEHRFLFRQAKRLNRALWGETHFDTLVYDEDPDDIIERTTLHFDPGRRELSVRPTPEGDIAFSWKVPLDYLEDVVLARPEWYVEHPVMLDWNWLTGRVRDESRRVTRDRRVPYALVAGLAVGAIVGAAVTRAYPPPRPLS